MSEVKFHVKNSYELLEFQVSIILISLAYASYDVGLDLVLVLNESLKFTKRLF